MIFGVNFEMRDYQTGRKKKLDLVVARPAGEATRAPKSLAALAADWQITLDANQSAKLANLPDLEEGVVGAVLVALEAKAAMTAHTKARPRLYDELNSSHLTVHGASRQALAVGFVMVNLSATFVSPGLQAAGPVVSQARAAPRRPRDRGQDPGNPPPRRTDRERVRRPRDRDRRVRERRLSGHPRHRATGTSARRHLPLRDDGDEDRE